MKHRSSVFSSQHWVPGPWQLLGVGGEEKSWPGWLEKQWGFLLLVLFLLLVCKLARLASVQWIPALLVQSAIVRVLNPSQWWAYAGLALLPPTGHDLNYLL